MTTLSLEEQTALKALVDACNYSLGAHVPLEAITGRVPKHLRGDIKKGLKKLRAKQLCQEHPTGRNVTWQLTRAGLVEAQSF